MRYFTSYTTVMTTLLLAATTTLAAAPSVDQALKLKPVQDDIEYAIPSDAEAKKCTIKAEKIDGQTGWVIRDETGQILRRFVDSNADNVVDQWCYYQDGLEVYRDIDSNHNGKADQSRWINTAGTRWGFDKTEDGRIDSWKVISPEEVTSEVVAAMASRDTTRFTRLLLKKEELAQLGLGEQMAKDLGETIKTAGNDFKEATRTQKTVTGKTQWASFGAVRPGLVPKGTKGSTKDIIVYENVVAMVDTDGKHGEVLIGTLIRVGDAWRVVDAPKSIDPNRQEMVDTGKFFTPASYSRPDVAGHSPEGPGGETQKLLRELEALDKKNPGATYDAGRVKLLERLATTADGQDRGQWIRQLADMLAAAAQTGEHAKGVDDLKALYLKLAKDKTAGNLTGYVKFRYLQSDYNLSFQKPNPDFAKIQTAWVASLETYVKDFSNGSLTPEAMLQLGMAQEFAGQEKEAKEWYGRLAKKFPKSEMAPKAAGAKRRLDSVGKVLTLKGRNHITGKQFDLERYRGKVVLFHYWATWCEPCKSDMSQIKELLAKYGGKGFMPVGISVDSDAQELTKYLKGARLPKNWPHLFEPGGIDNSRLANELGILSLPTMILIDKKGRVANRNIHVTELDIEVRKLLR